MAPPERDHRTVGDDLRIAEGAAAKGSIVLPLIKVLRARRDESLRELPPELHHYLDERVILTHWYPAREHHRLTQLLGEMTGHNWEMLGRGLALSELTGTYRNLVKPGEPLRTLRSLPGLWKLNHNTGELVTEHTPGGARVQITGWALALHEHVQIMCGYMLQLLDLCEVAEPRVALVEHIPPPHPSQAGGAKRASLVVVDAFFSHGN